MTSPLNQIMNKLDEIDRAESILIMRTDDECEGYLVKDIFEKEIKSLTSALRTACKAFEYYQGKLYHADKAIEEIAEKLKVLS